MKIYSYILIGLIFTGFGSCTKAKIVFEKSTWWNWHWQKKSDTLYFFSGGSTKVKEGEKGIVRYYFSTRDTIFSDFLVIELVDYDHKERWKIMKSNMEEYLRIIEIDESTIEVLGPVSQIEDLYDHSDIYTRLPDDATNVPLSDSILYDW